MSEVGAKWECSVCHELLVVMELIPSGDQPNKFIQKLSCGHEGRITIMDPIKESISIRDKVEAEVRTVKTLGETPLLVSGSSGAYLTSGGIQTTVKQGKVLGGNYYFAPVNQYYVKIDNSTTTYNVQTIYNIIDNLNNLTPGEKVIAKDTITKVTDLFKATGFTVGKITELLSLLRLQF
jgi:hypothetical protein